jgi:signal transduction histidine kinase
VRKLARRVLAMLRRHPTAADAVVAVVFAAAALISLSTIFELLRQDPSFDLPAKPPLVLALLAVTLPLALRRRFPLTVAGAVIIAFVVGRVALAPAEPSLPAWEGIVTVWACWLALYSAVVHGRRTRLTTLALAALAAILLGEVAREIYGTAFMGLPLNQGFQLVYTAVFFLAWPLALGVAVRSLRNRDRELAAQAIELQREREENARRAVLEERVRIARELHDVVAHHVSVMGIQAGAARRVMGRQPDKAAQALNSIEASSRQAVVELHRLLGFLRRAGQTDELAPQPDLAQLTDLVAQAGQGELTVALSVEGEPRPLPPTLEVSAYRVVQEALTNALKHSGGTTAMVRVGYRPTVLEVEVLDDGNGGAEPPRINAGDHGLDHGQGHGLIGMRERVTLHGGHLRAGPRPQGGFAVHATFPLNGRVS